MTKKVEPMTLGRLEGLLKDARSAGAGDDAPVYVATGATSYMKDVRIAEFQKREGWPEKEWPVVISTR
jgi:hypothetical protein